MHHDVSLLCSLGTILLHVCVFSKLQHQNAKLFCEPYKHFDNYRNLRNFTYITIRSYWDSRIVCILLPAAWRTKTLHTAGSNCAKLFYLLLSMRHDSQTIARFESIVLNDKLSTYSIKNWAYSIKNSPTNNGAKK